MVSPLSRKITAITAEVTFFKEMGQRRRLAFVGSVFFIEGRKCISIFAFPVPIFSFSGYILKVSFTTSNPLGYQKWSYYKLNQFKSIFKYPSTLCICASKFL